MKCLRIYATDDGESHFDEVEIGTTSTQVHPDAVAFEMSQNSKQRASVLHGFRQARVK